MTGMTNGKLIAWARKSAGAQERSAILEANAMSDQIAWHMVDWLRSKEGMWLDYYGHEYGYVSFVVSFPKD